jgi:hypothetical protein
MRMITENEGRIGKEELWSIVGSAEEDHEKCQAE